jgi:hypothetical protein
LQFPGDGTIGIQQQNSTKWKFGRGPRIEAIATNKVNGGTNARANFIEERPGTLANLKDVP